MSAPKISAGLCAEEEIFQAVLDLPPTARANYLDQCCGTHTALRLRIDRLLAAHDDANFMQKKANATVLDSLEAELAQVVPEQPGARIGNYKLLEKIGEGGCGIVYMAEQEAPLRRTVALKILKFGTDTKSVIARFLQERQALALMDHPNIARVFEAGATDKGRPFFAMELVRGIKITNYCSQNHLSAGERLGLFSQVCHAVQHAHQKGVIHRDLKPSNILVTLQDGTPIPKVIDFGIAKATGGERLTEHTLFTAFAQFIGTPAYMSPEQAEMSSPDIDTRSDIYSLGVLLYELLTGHTPFDGQALISSGIDAMRKTIREQEPVRPSTRLTQELSSSETLTVHGFSVPTEAEAQGTLLARERLKEQINRLRGDLDWIVLKCLEKDRSRRYQTASDLAADLRRHLHNEPVQACPPSAAYKVQKAWRRNKLAFTAGAAVFIALVLGTSLSTWQAFEAGKARNDEKKQRLTAQNERDNAREAQNHAENAEKAMNHALLEANHHLYVGNMNLAGQAWERHSYERVRNLLEETRQAPERGFEWFYWQRQTHLNLHTLRGHFGRVTAVSFSPDGQLLASGGDDAALRIWNVATGQLLFTLCGHLYGVNCIVFSPDGHQILSASYDGTIKFWDATTGTLLSTFRVSEGGVRSVALSRDGARILTGSGDGTAKIWDRATQRLIATFIGHTKAVTCASFSPDEKTVLTGSADRTARLWETDTAKLIYVFPHETEVSAALFFPDGQKLITGSISSAKLWNGANGLELPIKLDSHASMGALAISGNGQRIVSGSWDSTARLWNANRPQVEQMFLGHTKGIFAVGISPDGTRVATAANEGGLKIWQATDPPGILKIDGPNHEVLAVAISPDGSRIVTGAGLFNFDGSVEGSGNLSAQVWDLKTQTRLFTLEGHQSGVSSVAFSLDGSQILTGSGDSTAKLWDAATGRLLHTFGGHSNSVNAVAFLPDKLRIVTASQDHTGRVWEIATERELFPLVGHGGQLSSVAVSPNGRWIITGSADGTARLWSAADGAPQRKIETDLDQILSVSCSPDSSWLLATGFGHAAKLWNILDTNRPPILLKGHANVISSSAFSHDGRRIVTGSYDETARVWEAATGHEVLRLDGHQYPVYSVAFSLDDQRIISTDYDRTVRISEAATPRELDAWEAEEKDSEADTLQE